jgi:Fur family peroxide stress response transcriptional regulator
VIIDDVEVESRLENLKAACRKAGVKLTHQRLEIFRELAASLEHPSAEAVFRAVRKRMPTVSLDTVYRTLWMLSDLGLVATLGPRRESVRFDANLAPHHHYICVNCGLARDFESAEFNDLDIPEAAKQFGGVASVHVEIRGTCEQCARKQPGQAALAKAGGLPKPRPEGGRE